MRASSCARSAGFAVAWLPSSGLTGVMGAGVQGLAEAPWLDLDTPAATNGWWARNATLPLPVTGPRDGRGGDLGYRVRYG